ncbi:hypothetical protein ERO13_A07G027150v2 [Gossypium hirsutum]|uniref:Uncharacterized protein n=2 Tax=Gossypium TaxID=3633 RepID=A0A5J5UYZ0_GOSBA|nr:hypothetical protein ES319_A07G032000v1 [Gossypium barbadense]KAG4190386.1 hypothetical protein ERO13_A07G027150v2 [Gossypium hirsutum]TYH08657.1 hypothetical protein ES288_A07G033300v1 [Gossypium darwinii]
MAFFATIWSIWLWRNSMVYNGKIFDIIQLFETIKLRLGWWCKAQRQTVAASLNDFFFWLLLRRVLTICLLVIYSSLVIFSKAIGVVDPVLAEIIAIKEALKISYASK